MTKFKVGRLFLGNFSAKYLQICCLPKSCNTYRHIYSQNNAKTPLHFKYSSEIQEAVNKQIQIEQQAAQDYLSIAIQVLHPSHLRPGAGGFFMRMYEEEIAHMHLFILYQLRRGAKPVIRSLKEPAVMAKVSLLDAFRKALDMEKCVTESLESLIAIAESAKDYQCAEFVTSKFLTDQMTSIDELAQHVVNLCKISDTEHALYHYDLQLAKRYPYKYSTL